MARYAFVIFAGALIAFYQNQLPDRHWSALAPLLLVFAWQRPDYRLVMLSAAAFLWCSGLLHLHLDQRLAADFDGREALIEGRVADIVEVHDERLRFELEPSRIENYPGRPPRRLRLNWYRSDARPAAGETWRLRVRLRRPGGYLNPGGFDYQGWLLVQGIDGLGYVRPSPENRRLEPASRFSLNARRDALAGALARHCRDCAHLGLVQALVLGFRGRIEPAQNDALRATGTAHLLAISGLHVGLIAGLCFGLGRAGWRLGLYRTGASRQQVAALAALFGAFGYAALAGFSLPTVRALIMLAALLLALLLRQRINLLQSAALALIVILLLDPRAVGSMSLWLSMSALLIIGLAQPRLAGAGGWWRQLLILQLYFSLLMLPLGVILFGQAAPAGFAANLVAIPLVGFLVLPLSLLAGLLAALDLPLAAMLLGLLDRILSLLLDYLRWLLELGLPPLAAHALPALLAVAVLPLLALCLIPLSQGLKRALITAAAVAVSWSPARLPAGEFRLDVLDVGMGTSVVVRTRWHSLVYDFGPGDRRGFSAADWTLIPFLRSRGIESPDLMIVSHVDQDHSGGFRSFLERAADLPVVTGTPSELAARFDLDRAPVSCHGYPPWTWDGVRFRFVSVAAIARAGATNNRSCVLLVSGYHRALLPGDIESVQENRLVDALGAGLRAEILLAPHHGSDTSSSRRFLEAVAPRYVIYTVGRGNRWRFPHGAVTRRYAALGIRQFQSDRHGAVSFSSRAGKLDWRSLRDPPRRIWRRW